MEMANDMGLTEKCFIIGRDYAAEIRGYGELHETISPVWTCPTPTSPA